MHRLHLPSRLLCWAVCYDERGRELPSHRNSVSKHDGAPFVSYPQQLDVGSSQFNTRVKKKKKNWTFKDLQSDKCLNYAIHWQYCEFEHLTEKASVLPTSRVSCPNFHTRAYFARSFNTCRKRDCFRSKPPLSQEHLISLHFSKLSRFSLKS